MPRLVGIASIANMVTAPSKGFRKVQFLSSVYPIEPKQVPILYDHGNMSAFEANTFRKKNYLLLIAEFSLCTSYGHTFRDAVMTGMNALSIGHRTTSFSFVHRAR